MSLYHLSTLSRNSSHQEHHPYLDYMKITYTRKAQVLVEAVLVLAVIVTALIDRIVYINFPHH